jgi:NADH-quinone oxidoreductase subunit N
VNVDAVLTTIAGAVGWVSSEALLILTACGLYLAAPFSRRAEAWRWISLAALLVAWWLLPSTPETSAAYAGLFKADGLSWFFRHLSFGTGLLLLLTVWGRLASDLEAEQWAFLLLIIAGMGLTAAANDLIVLFLALELVSIPTYVLLYFPEAHRPLRDDRMAEAAMKYFMLSIFSAAIFLYGVTFLYGTVGSTNLEVIRAGLRETLGRSASPVLLVALVAIFGGLGFRITAAPFHFYAPDVYEGGPPLTVALLSVVPKIAGFAALPQLVGHTLLVPTVDVLNPLVSAAAGLCWVLAVASMLFGNVLGLWQGNLRRMLAYSGIAHTGYMLIGLGAGSSGTSVVPGLPAVIFYLLVYTLMTFGLFAAVTLLNTSERPVENVDDLAGLGKSHPWLALMLAVCLLSLTGLPPTAGFLAKLNIFLVAWDSDQYLYRLLAVLMALFAAVGAWYYLRIIAVMYLRDAVKPLSVSVPWTGLLAVALCTAGNLWYFVHPGGVWQEAVKAAEPAAVKAVMPHVPAR